MDVYKGEGNFQQCEFTAFGGSNRPDFVILYDKSFHYFEVKSEYDSLSRLNDQFTNARGLFSHLTLVIPRSKHKSYVNYICDKSNDQIPSHSVMFLDNLEKGVKTPFLYQDNIFSIYIDRVAKILWKDELKHYVQEKNPSAWCTGWSGNKVTLSQMSMLELNKFFDLYYCDNDSLRILNEVLPARKYNYRLSREKLI